MKRASQEPDCSAPASPPRSRMALARWSPSPAAEARLSLRIPRRLSACSPERKSFSPAARWLRPCVRQALPAWLAARAPPPQAVSRTDSAPAYLQRPAQQREQMAGQARVYSRPSLLARLSTSRAGRERRLRSQCLRQSELRRAPKPRRPASTTNAFARLTGRASGRVASRRSSTPSVCHPSPRCFRRSSRITNHESPITTH